MGNEPKDLEAICERLKKHNYQLEVEGTDMTFCIYSTTNIPCKYAGIFIKTIGMYECKKEENPK